MRTSEIDRFLVHFGARALRRGAVLRSCPPGRAAPSPPPLLHSAQHPATALRATPWFFGDPQSAVVCRPRTSGDRRSEVKEEGRIDSTRSDRAVNRPGGHERSRSPGSLRSRRPMHVTAPRQMSASGRQRALAGKQRMTAPSLKQRLACAAGAQVGNVFGRASAHYHPCPGSFRRRPAAADSQLAPRSSRTIPAWPAVLISLAPAVRAKPRLCAMWIAAGVGTMGSCAANTPPRPRR